MADHLYPARPGMLRRGTPVWCGGCEWMIDRVAEDGSCVLVTEDDTDDAGWQSVRLDLSDVTARAHAAIVYTELHIDPDDMADWPAMRIPPWDGTYRTPPNTPERDREISAAEILCRMRASDETVTPDEARAALDWAHEVAA